MLLDGYIRVSRVSQRESDSFISAAVQREQVEGWINSHEATVGEVFEELDQSGARSDRPLLMRAIERIEAGESGGLVVAKLDRFGRSVVEGLRAIQRIQVAGGSFISVQDGLDIETATGKLVLNILFSIGEWELDRVRSNWDVARARAIARGAYVGPAPIGYRREKNGRLRIDPSEGVVIRDIFARRAAGESYGSITNRVNQLGYRTRTGAATRVSDVTRWVRNPVYRGEARSGQFRNPNAHPPIVEPALWQKAQAQGRVPPRRTESLLSGMVRCASCGRMMWTLTYSAREARHNVYRCSPRGRNCNTPALLRDNVLDPLVEEFVFMGGDIPRQDQGAAREEAAVSAAEEELAAYRDEPLALTTLGAASFAEGLASRQRQLELRLLELANMRRRQTAPQVNVVALEEDWPQLSWEERRRALRELIDFVVIFPGSEPLRERVRIFTRGWGPVVLKDGSLGNSFDPASGERLPVWRRWAVPRLEKELRSFLSERESWPDYREFAREGKARLHAQAMLWGGPFYWSAKLGLRPPFMTVRWSEERVAGALEPFLAGRDRWPSRAAFKEAGLLPVFNAVAAYGGVTYWAKRFGLLHRKGRRFLWPEARIERELLRLAGDSGEFPTQAEMRARGPGGLARAARKNGGFGYWAERLGLRLSLAQRRQLTKRPRVTATQPP